MTNTIRERLVQNLSSKRARLLKDKEQLDIADTNALLLHPSQFSITNPVSPGGGPTSRKTPATGSLRRRNGPKLEMWHIRRRRYIPSTSSLPIESCIFSLTKLKLPLGISSRLRTRKAKVMG